MVHTLRPFYGYLGNRDLIRLWIPLYRSTWALRRRIPTTDLVPTRLRPDRRGNVSDLFPGAASYDS
jgi:hypothetical protein